MLCPLGIEDGVAQCLFAADGRYVGMLNVSTRRPRRAPDPARAVVTLLTEALAAAVDPHAGLSPEEIASDVRRPDAWRPGGLSPRELQVLAELTAGRTNREIAERLYITPRTVGTHIEHILAKLDLPSGDSGRGPVADSPAQIAERRARPRPGLGRSGWCCGRKGLPGGSRRPGAVRRRAEDRPRAGRTRVMRQRGEVPCRASRAGEPFRSQH
ncbi:response regulator transcription factor [Streptomyces sp. NPDC056230]|uniref:response regulator transcription factor n=1 Tax=Streptomyces sp. NPDC056230 TaxID=3345754 RepID=UPI0035DA17AC